MTDRAAAIDGAMRRARAEAPFLATMLDLQPDIAADLAAGTFDLTGNDYAELSVERRLRLQRRALALKVAIGDLAGLLDLTAVTLALTDFADHALDLAIRTAIRERVPDAEPAGFVGIALGKQGSRELNYSSDIDPILLYDPDTLPRRPREEPAEAAVRIARRVVELLQARTGDGYVLRVDLRLRPSPEVTPIALPLDAAISYYESQALAWERAAFIRARAAAGEIALGQRFLDAIRPFVWRQGLDFGALHEIRDISRRIRDHHAKGQVLGPGYDLKRGRGGIREAEFFAQIHQLIHGGRDPALRTPATRDALSRLSEAGWIEPGAAQTLIRSYTLLRTIEHRVQMIDDRQTHALPKGEALDGVARLHGLPDGRALIELIIPSVTATAEIYDALAGDDSGGLSFDAERLADQLAEGGFADGGGAAQRVIAWRGGRYPALRSAAAQTALEAVLPTLMPAFAGAPDPSTALLRFDAMLERLPSAINLFRLLEARPALAALLAAILSHAPPLADALARRSVLLDGLIDASALAPIDDLPLLVAEMRGGDVADYQARLEHVRRVVGEKRFALGAQIVAGAADPLDVAASYSLVAEAALTVLADAALREFAVAHGHVPGSELVILAFGRFGGAALTHASDLDLVYLFTGDFQAESDGAKPLGATLYHTRLAQRITAALSVPTASGPLYAVDTRLRPSGADGPLVVSVASFARYQRDDAWSWEHMALTRARVVYGSSAARAEVGEIIDGVLAGERPGRDVRADAVAMRADMASHKPPAGVLDAKLLPGGLVDLEFAVHTIQLSERRGFDPDLGRAIDALVAADLLPPTAREAHDILTRLLVTLRLVAPDAAEPSAATQALIAATLRMPDWAATVRAFATAREAVAAIWSGVTHDDRR